jgi:hypothetical protein
MTTKEDTRLLEEAYISATQKTVNVPPRVPYRQVGDEHTADTLSHKMQGINIEDEEPDNDSSETDSSQMNYDDIVKRLMTPEEDIVKTAEQEPMSSIGIAIGTVDRSGCESVKMSKTDLYSIFTAAKKLHDIVDSGHELDPWMSHKLAICSDSISNILKVVEYDHDKSGCISSLG